MHIPQCYPYVLQVRVVFVKCQRQSNKYGANGFSN